MAVALNFREEGVGKPLVLLHPVGLDLNSWNHVVPLLAPHRRVIAADLRGHGDSPREPWSSDIYDYAGDVAALIERLDVGPCPVAGVSFGGMVTTALAIARPDLVSAAVISACPSTIPEAGRPVLRARGERVLGEGMEAVLAETMERWFSPGFMGGAEAEHYRRHLLGLDPADWNMGWQTIAALDLTARLGEIACPVDFIHAENDKGTSLDAISATAARVRDARLDVIGSAPHMVHIEHPGEFAHLLLAHLERSGA